MLERMLQSKNNTFAQFAIRIRYFLKESICKRYFFFDISRNVLHSTIAYSEIVTKDFHQLRRQLKEQSDYKELQHQRQLLFYNGVEYFVKENHYVHDLQMNDSTLTERQNHKKFY